MGDKASISKKLQKQAKLQGKEMTTPKNKPRGGKLSNTEQAANKKISKTCQIIEIRFAWVHSRTGIRKANLVYSTRGSIRHIYGALLSVSIP